MKTTPTIGIVTRTKKRTVLLRRALESVINQSYPKWKLIVVNDGGDPFIVDELIAQYSTFTKQIEVVHNPESLGMEVASNIGLKKLDTDYAVIHDDDDSWSPEFLKRSILVLEKERKILPSLRGIVCYTNRAYETVRGNSVIIEYTQPFNHWIKPGVISLDRMLYENMFPPISFIFSLDDCRELGYFDETLPVLGDWDFNIKFLLHHDIWILPEPMAFYHHRLDATGALGNTVVSGLDRHMLYRGILLNKWLRDDLNGKGTGLGIYTNQRINTERLFHVESTIHNLETKIQKSTDHSFHFEDKLQNITDISYGMSEKIQNCEDNIMNATDKISSDTNRIILFIEKLKAKIKAPWKNMGNKV